MYRKTKKGLFMTDINFNSYEVIATVRGQEVVYFMQFGRYQGEWVLVSKDENNYYVYKGSYGSCSGCDHLEAEDPNTLEEAQKFIQDYIPFITLTKEVALSAISRKELQTLFPANFRDEYDDFTLEEIVPQIELLIKSREGIITSFEILDIIDLEQRRKAIERMTEETFMEGLQGVIESIDGDDMLVRVKRVPEDFVFVNVKDSSTSRRYMLRVPPDTKTVLEGKAWTFNLSPQDYKLQKET